MSGKLQMIMGRLNSILTNFKKNPKQMVIVISSAVLLVLVVDLLLILQPQVARVSAVRSELGKVTADVKTALSDIARIDAMKQAVEAYNEKIIKYEKTLPTEEGIPGLLERLSEMAKNANMRIAGIMPIERKEPEAGVYKEIPIMITAKAGYHELGRFLSGLENSDRFMKVTDMEIKADKMFPKKHNVDILVVTYVLLEGR
ncbi:MAG: type 4a pilus biogenesis protein PilO [Candidatus Omnitrophota bacterium]